MLCRTPWGYHHRRYHIAITHSVKDRIALNMIETAEAEGLISPDTTVLVGAWMWVDCFGSCRWGSYVLVA